MTVWLELSWWKYLLEKPAYGGWKIRYIWRSFNCRRRNHPAGIIYFNPGGTKPNNHCKNCFDDLG